MTYENLCMYCFEDLRGQTTCPHCGRDSRAAVPQIQMLPGSRVYHDRFLIGRALGQDATGIVYAALDTKRDNKLRIREYLPRDCAERLNDGAVVPIAGMEDQFEAGIKKLRASVESVEDPRKRHFFFEENGTAYIAQRKTAAPAPAEAPAQEEETGGGRRVLLFAGIAVAVLVVAAVLLITVFNGALPTSRDITQSPTLDPSEVWIPATTPTPTPYVAPTFAALVDPELSWMDYTYDGDVEQEYQQAQRASTTPTPKPVPTATRKADSSGYTLINGGSDAATIRRLQKRLNVLGWLDEDDITGEYDAATRQAVRDFQRYVNERYSPDQKLTVDGAAGPMTQRWLYEVDATKPTPTPTPKVTPKPDDSAVDEKSPASLVRPVQRKLITLGLLPEGSADGSYGATTAAAVRQFQQRVNLLAGYDVLEVTGRMDAQSLAFLDYYAEEWARLREATAEPTATPEPTRRPTATPTTRPVESLEGVIDANASKEDIRKVQQLLVDIGLLPAKGVDGVYGSGTISAVADFQQWVNDQRDEQTLTVNGEVDQMTLAYLEYCKDHGLMPYGTPTPAPTKTPTKAPTQAPTEAPEIEPEGDDEDEEPDEDQEITIDADSDPESIRYVQQMLSAVGAMDESGVDGVFGRGTARAVARFQEWVNSVQGEGTLEVNGRMDNKTRLALEYAYDRDLTMAEPTEAPTVEPTEAPTPEPTEAPTPEPTEAPEEEEPEGDQEITVGKDSDPESIRYVQQMLSSVGILDEDDVNGSYDSATVDAVRAFQAWVNRVQGSEALPVTGQVDDRTRQALEYAYDRDWRVEGATTEAPEPTEVPEPEPTEAPAVGSVGDIDIAFDDVAAGSDVVSVAEGQLTVRWRAQGDVDSYYVSVEDGQGRAIAREEGTEHTGFTVNTDQMAPGEVYTLRLGVLPEGGGQDDIVWRTARFMLPEQVTPEPTEAPTPEPAVAEVSAPRITIAGTTAGSSTISIEEDSVQVGWASEGDVESYYLRVTDSEGNDIFEPRYTTQTGFNLRTDDMQPGMLYTLTVGVLPEGGTNEDVLFSRAQFMRPATPGPTEIPTPEPTEVPTPAPQVATIGMPVVTIGGSAYQVDGVSFMTDSNIIISWNADGDVESYTIYVENQAGERQELGTTTDTSRTVSAKSLPAGLYTIYVGALPEGGDRDDMQWGSARFGIPAPTEEPTEEPEREPEGDAGYDADDEPAVSGAISGSSDAETVQQLQMKLYSLGLLSTDGLEPGVLDTATLQAVAEFQTRVNEQFDADLDVVDPTDLTSVVDAATVRAIFAS